MASFKLKYSVSILPTETNTLSDGSETVRTINSNIDKVLTSSIEKSAGTTATNVKYTEYLTTTTKKNLSDFFQSEGADADFIFIKIASAGSTGTPDVQITFDDSLYHQKLSGVGDWTLIRLSSVDMQTQYSTKFYLKSSGATTVANIVILTGQGL